MFGQIKHVWISKITKILFPLDENNKTLFELIQNKFFS